MGIFNWPVRISSLDGQQVMDIVAAVNTGVAFTTLPCDLLRELGVKPMGSRRLLLADGRRIEMEFGQAQATIDGNAVTTIVAFGSGESRPLLGRYTLDGLALAVDPIAQRLVPALPKIY